MEIAQITHSYKPIAGGADVWAQLVREVCEAAGHSVDIYQRPASGVEDEAVHFVRSPLGGLLGGRGEFWTVPFGLLGRRGELSEYDLLIAHYPIHHLMVEWHPGTILVSHGVFWDDRPGALRSFIKRRLARRAYRTASAVVANDTFFLREVGEDVPAGTEPFTEVGPSRFFVPNCVDVERFGAVEPHPRLGEWPVILVPRNLYRNRGIHLAIQAFAACKGELNEARLVIVGGVGQAGYARECRALADDLGIAERVVFFGPVPWEQMNSVYSAAELTVIPSLCGEGTSLAALESMSCGTAAVTTNVGGLADLPTVQCNPNAEALAEAVLGTWSEREAVGEQQRDVVRSTYNLDNWRNAWLDILERFDGQ